MSDGVSLEDVRKQRVRFLRTELKLGMTFAGIAHQSDTRADKKQRNQENARKAYDTVMRNIGDTTLTREEGEDLDLRLAELKTSLLALGEAL